LQTGTTFALLISVLPLARSMKKDADQRRDEVALRML
jgi:hypothetical protein